ncbi:MAG: DUF2231 domain-containing protein [Betaproteobacteria bacterium]
MIEIIPNWHPALVHFPIALILVAAFFTVVAKLASDRPVAGEWAATGRWTLRCGAVLGMAAALAGWVAFNSVDHDDAGHVAMLLHRDWAMGTMAAMVVLVLWEILQTRAGRPVSWRFAAALALAAGGVVTTGWLGSELVYRHRLGVMPPPVAVEPPPPAVDPLPKMDAPVPPPAPGARHSRGHDHSGHKH